MKYVKWERVVSWKRRLRSEGRPEEESYPYSFGSRDKAFLGFVGDVLWLVTLPRYGGYRQAPSLVARLDIVDAGAYDGSGKYSGIDPEVRDSGENIVFAKREAGAYLPLNNMFHTMLGLEFRGRAPSIAESYARRDRTHDATRGPYFSLAQHFRKHRYLTDAGALKLEVYAAAVRRGRRVFLSYKRSDFPPGQTDDSSWPAQLGNELTSKEISCWWDRWNLPQDDGDTGEELSDRLLEGLLDDAVQQAVWFVALVGPDYLVTGDESWPRREWGKAGVELAGIGRRHNMHRIAVFFSEPSHRSEYARWVEPGDRQVWVGADATPAVVAQMIAREIDADRGVI